MVYLGRGSNIDRGSELVMCFDRSWVFLSSKQARSTPPGAVREARIWERWSRGETSRKPPPTRLPSGPATCQGMGTRLNRKRAVREAQRPVRGAQSSRAEGRSREPRTSWRFAGNPFNFLGHSRWREARLRSYILRQHRLGRRLSELIDDPYVRRCGSRELAWKVATDPSTLRALAADVRIEFERVPVAGSPRRKTSLLEGASLGESLCADPTGSSTPDAAVCGSALELRSREAAERSRMPRPHRLGPT